MKRLCLGLVLLLCALLCAGALPPARTEAADPEAAAAEIPETEAPAAPEAVEAPAEAADAPVPEPEIVPEPAVAPEAEPAPAPEEDPEAEVAEAAETGETAPEAAESPEPEPEEAPVSLPAEAAEPAESTEPEAPDARSAADLPDFTRGYARLLERADACPGAEPGEAARAELAAGGVVYAVARARNEGADRLQVCFCADGERLTLWVDARFVCPLDADAVEAYVRAAAGEPLAVYADEARTLPLTPVGCRIPAAEAPALAAAEAVGPEGPAGSAMELPRTSLTLGVGETFAIAPEFTDGAEHTVRYTSAQKKTASVSAKGVVKGVKAGKTTVTVTDEGGSQAEIRVTVKKAPASVSLNAKKLNLGVGCGFQLKATLSKGAASALTFSSGDPSVAAVDAAGAVTALAPGKAKITVRTFNKKSASVTITVKPAPASVRLTPQEAVLGVGERLTLTAAVDKGSLAEFVYASERPEIAGVDPRTGAVQALQPGVTAITVTTQNGLTDTCVVTVAPAPTGIALDAASLKLGVGEKSAPLAWTLLEEGAAGAVSFTSSDAKVAKVTAAGVVKGVKAGTAKITAKTYNGKKATLKVTVKKAPASVAVTPAKLELGAGETAPIQWKLSSGSAGGVTLQGYDGEIVSVSGDGLVTALKPGRTSVTVRTYNGKKASCTVVVREAPSSVALSTDALALGAGETAALKAALPEGAAGTVRFTSGAPEIASVNAKTGEVKGLRPGRAIVTAAAYNGVTAECAVAVQSAPTGVRFQEKSVTVAAGDSVQLGAPVLLGDDACCGTFTYSSADKKCAKVGKGGLVKGVREGTTKVTVKTYNGKSASIKVYVKAAPKSLKFAVKSLVLPVGESWTAQAVADNGVACSCSLALSGEGVVEFAADGRTLRAVAPGEVTLTAKAFNGKKATLRIAVPPLPDSLALDSGSLTLGAGDSAALRAVFPEGQASAVLWQSSDPSVAAVDSAGMVTALRPGQAAISAATVNGRTASCAVNVLAAPTELRLAPRRSAYALSEGSVQLEVRFGSAAEGGRWSAVSSKPAVAAVSADGRITFGKAGSTRVTVTTYNGLRAEFALVVTGDGEGLRFAAPEITVPLGAEAPLPITYAAGGGSYTVSAADAEIVAVEDSWIRGLSLGSTELTALGYNGETAVCRVTVVPGDGILALSADRAELRTGDTLQLTAAPLPEAPAELAFASSDPKVASVDAQTGLVTARATGECLITARASEDGPAAYCRVVVCGLLDGVKIGIDPGHQKKADMSLEAIAPGSTKMKFKVSGGCGGYVTKVQEYKLVLDVGFQLRDALEALGAEVYMTRTKNNVNISNQQRAIMMNEYGVDLVLRLHCNSISNHSANGISTWVRSSGTKKKDCARAGEALLRQMVAATGARNDGLHKNNGYTGLNWSTVPSVLVEMGYMSNAAEDRKLNDPKYQAKLVQGMVNGICEYMGVER